MSITVSFETGLGEAAAAVEDGLGIPMLLVMDRCKTGAFKATVSPRQETSAD